MEGWGVEFSTALQGFRPFFRESACGRTVLRAHTCRKFVPLECDYSRFYLADATTGPLTKNGINPCNAVENSTPQTPTEHKHSRPHRAYRCSPKVFVGERPPALVALKCNYRATRVPQNPPHVQVDVSCSQNPCPRCVSLHPGEQHGFSTPRRCGPCAGTLVSAWGLSRRGKCDICAVSEAQGTTGSHVILYYPLHPPP